MIKVSTLVNVMSSSTIDWRRHLHQYPELGFKEIKTASFLKSKLHEWGYQIVENYGVTGFLAKINENALKRPIAIRIDMDGLPVTEESNLYFKSENEGNMHACGHDLHMAIGLGLAKIFAEHKKDFDFPVTFIFQPAEELLSGAASMINDGVLSAFSAEAIFGLHVWNQIPIGEIAFNKGPIMASIDAFVINVIGQGGHGSSPHLTIDPVVTAAHIATMAQTILSRNISAFDEAVLSITSIQGGETINVIPPNAVLRGSIRTYKEETRYLIRNRLEKITRSVAAGMGCDVNIEWINNAPALVNDLDLYNSTIGFVEKLPYKNATNFRLMGSEDASYFWNEIPGIYTFVGAYLNGENQTHGHHHPQFLVDEEALKIGMEVLLAQILEFENVDWQY